jgi:hypothetical protein
MIRPMTSCVSALSGIVANGHQAIHFVSSAPLRFRTAGFPQYGSKRAVSRDLRCPRNLYAVTVEISSAGVCSVIGLASGGTRGL